MQKREINARVVLEITTYVDVDAISESWIRGNAQNRIEQYLMDVIDPDVIEVNDYTVTLEQEEGA
ncbi:MAG: hypothetical protein OEQ39_04250 [Gammaproteobacteria bacterium]|nr:hypothetical protein [Gammaproteobacteria bacterium]